MCGYWLRWAERSVEIVGTIAIGRVPENDLAFEDVKISRRHATITNTGSELWINDEGSRNGVFVNGTRIKERHRLRDGDTLRIGSQEFAVSCDPSSARGPESGGPATTRRFDPMGIVGQLAEKALALGRYDEAERLLSSPLEQLLRETEQGLIPSYDVLDKATGFAVRLLEGTRRGSWLDWLARMYGATRTPWPGAVVDALYQVARGAVGHDRRGLRNYCEVLRSVQSELGPAERFQVGRIEGLDRVLSAL